MKINYNLKWLAVIILLSAGIFYSCKKDSRAAAETPGQDTQTVARAANEVVNAWVTTSDRSKQLEAQTSFNFAADAGTNATTVTVDEN